MAGASGAIGGFLIPELLAAGHEVVGTSSRTSGAERVRALGAESVLLDVFDAAAVERAVATAAPDAIIHQLTALGGGSPVDNARIRRVGTRHLVDAARRAGVERMVAQSISWAYEPGTGPATESTPLDLQAPEPRSISVEGIRQLEETVAEMPQHVVLRYGMFYGPGTWYRRGGVADRVLRGDNSDPAAAGLAGLPANSGIRSFLHVQDAARAAVAALHWPNGPVNIVDDEPAPASEWVPVLAAAFGAPIPEAVPGGAAWERGASNARARALGWKPMHASWRTGFSA
ncbi:NAD(P)-dependent oxidoreductase [Nocardia yamanashiensis]|uniref:NAD-dependent epimerase/dehydratase family protein n=1 Tax=Nocardia yamanashiensis TaxID=209247 RepID=UPI001E51745E|nr:NAD(P)-dependent oxidoreductase [Nocardia yamanashiensis]UGT38760.1 NAD(P)-dependent oxidoreductase [Nocardia yamanashiensis]